MIQFHLMILLSLIIGLNSKEMSHESNEQSRSTKSTGINRRIKVRKHRNSQTLVLTPLHNKNSNKNNKSDNNNKIAVYYAKKLNWKFLQFLAPLPFASFRNKTLTVATMTDISQCSWSRVSGLTKPHSLH